MKKLIDQIRLEESRDRTEVDETDARSSSDRDPSTIRYDNYPLMHRVMPTRLGNILRAAEDYGSLRYDFDSIYLWPRLSAVLPSEYLTGVERAKTEYQTPLVVSFWSTVLAAVSLLLVYNHAVPAGAFAIIFLGAVFLSFLFYWLSLPGARGYGDLITTAVDLFHNDLLERWWPELLEIQDTRVRLRALRAFVLKGTTPPLVRLATDEADVAEHESRLFATGTDWAVSSLDPEHDELDDAPNRGWRLSWLVYAVTVVFAILSYIYLDSSVWVLRASDDVEAFGHFDAKVARVQVPRGSVGDDVFVVSSKKQDVSVQDLDHRIALRRISDGTIIQRSDVTPPSTPVGAGDQIVELTRNRSEVAALDLKPGDEAQLIPGKGATADTAATCGDMSSTPTTPDMPATVLAIQAKPGTPTVSLVLRLDQDDVVRLCRAGVDSVEIIRSAS